SASKAAVNSRSIRGWFAQPRKVIVQNSNPRSPHDPRSPGRLRPGGPKGAPAAHYSRQKLSKVKLRSAGLTPGIRVRQIQHSGSPLFRFQQRNGARRFAQLVTVQVTLQAIKAIAEKLH